MTRFAACLPTPFAVVVVAAAAEAGDLGENGPVEARKAFSMAGGRAVARPTTMQPHTRP